MKSRAKEKPFRPKPSRKTCGVGKGKGELNEKNPMTETQERTQQTNNLGKYGEGEYDGSKTIEERLNDLKI
jgi:hypothetical protein